MKRIAKQKRRSTSLNKNIPSIMSALSKTGTALLFFCTSLLTAQAPAQPELGHRSAPLLQKNGLAFKDLNKNGQVDAYEDWRLPLEKRVQDLLKRMTLEEKTGFMIISSIRMEGDNTFTPELPKRELSSALEERDVYSTVNMFTRKPLRDTFLNIAATTKGVANLHLRHFILRSNASARLTAEWANNLQALAESTRLGIPAIVASNPRNHVTVDASMGLSQGQTVFSQWPGELGLAAMRDLELTRSFASIAAREWAAVGLRKGYMYMADLATEPRWERTEGTFGEDADLAADMIRAITLGFQGERLNPQSVALTIKHFPGGGPQVDGQDPHFEWGQDQHYPGKRFDYHLKPFQAAIDAGTSAIMPYYAKPIGTPFEQVAFAYNKAVIHDLLRKKMGFTGIVNSDTGPITMMPWGVEGLSLVERYEKALKAGVDIFSGGADPAPLLETVRSGRISEKRIDESVARLLREKFALGLFENPYTQPEAAARLVGNAEFQKQGDLALRKSIVLLRNEAQLLPLKPKTKVFFERHYDNRRGAAPYAPILPENNPWNLEFVKTPEEADVILLWLIPNNGGLFGSTGQPIDIRLSNNKIDVQRVNALRALKPTVIAVNFSNPWVVEEVDAPRAPSFLATFGTTPDALLDVVSGRFSPTGRMPISIPTSKAAVDQNLSDVPGYLKAGNYALFKFGDGMGY
jgi:beta-glucosidase